MVKNIIAGLMCLFCVNMLFNKAAIEWKEYWIDSLEQRLIDLQTKYDN